MNSRKKILIIDEEVDLCLLMKVYFLRKNYEVYISHSCQEALSLANDCQPNIILLPTASCQSQEKDIEKIREAFHDAEIIINNHHNYLDR